MIQCLLVVMYASEWVFRECMAVVLTVSFVHDLVGDRWLPRTYRWHSVLCFLL